MARSKKEQERYLEKRREMKKMSMRKAREKLRSDPVKYEEIKAKDRDRYRRKKEEGKVKLIGEMSNRDQRRIRQEWRKRSEKYRLKKKNEENIHDFVVSNSPPLTPESQIEIIQPSTSRQQECAVVATVSVQAYPLGVQLTQFESRPVEAELQCDILQRDTRNVNTESLQTSVLNEYGDLEGPKEEEEIHALTVGRDRKIKIADAWRRVHRFP
ncbi:hypothetical protein LSTR_LSTR009555 [Laodelphax striatellus]|uniref:Uncharacterized protein n=1 Tax=Laodelphax striatellus TaxID=195883 RepID=A0A482WS63_LAOST|nr:hypothetical protein LSTR_LSTR009555 [Laodelphax striatellus]